MYLAFSFHNFDFAPGKNFVQKKPHRRRRREVCSEPATNPAPFRGERNLFQRPSSPRPSPPGEGESSAGFLKIRATGFAGRPSAKPKNVRLLFLLPGGEDQVEGRQKTISILLIPRLNKLKLELQHAMSLLMELVIFAK